MELFINPFRQLAIWKSPLYRGYHECIKLNKDLSYKRQVYEHDGTATECLLEGIRREHLPETGWVRITVDRLNRWEDVWPQAVQSDPIDIGELS